MRWIAPRLLSRWALWMSLLVLLVCMVGTLVWLAGRYEVSQVENRMAEDASDAVSDIRNGLTRNVQSLQALQFAGQASAPWEQEAASLLREHREWLRLEWRDVQLQLKSEVD
ncbi:MAG: PAS domain-containing sensor histidine kinase, partial [Betaproteobacteria bacterium]